MKNLKALIEPKRPNVQIINKESLFNKRLLIRPVINLQENASLIL